MANNYYEATGTLQAKVITPVIKAIFKPYNIESDVSGKDPGEAYLATSEWSDPCHWTTMLDGVDVLAAELGLPVNTEDTMSGLTAVATHFKAQDHPIVQMLLQMHADNALEYEEPSINQLFSLAQAFDDGHGIEYVEKQGAWTCDKPRIGEFGGDGEFISDAVKSYSSSYNATENGYALHKFLKEGDVNKAAHHLASQMLSSLNVIHPVEQRNLLGDKAIAVLQDVWPGVPRRNSSVQSAFAAANKWGSRTDLQPMEIAHGVAYELQQFYHPNSTGSYTDLYNEHFKEEIRSNLYKNAEDLFD